MTQVIPVEMVTLADHEAVIARGLTTFIEVGTALLAIREGRLYREQYPTFEEYCHDRWGWERAHAYRLMNGAETAALLSPMGDIPTPTAERQVRPLTRLPREEQPAAWREAVEATGGGVPTQATVERIVRERAPEPIRRVRAEAASEYEYPTAAYEPAGTEHPEAWDFMHAIEDLAKIRASAFELRGAIHANQARWVEDNLDQAYALLNEFRAAWRARRAS